MRTKYFINPCIIMAPNTTFAHRLLLTHVILVGKQSAPKSCYDAWDLVEGEGKKRGGAPRSRSTSMGWLALRTA